MENAIERMAGIAFLAIGLSHLLRPAGWVEFFAQLRARGAEPEPGEGVDRVAVLEVSGVALHLGRAGGGHGDLLPSRTKISPRPGPSR